ncbi:Tim44 domain-containing protein [Ramlibacter albus]|uniref:Tim44 domain-containing protein n=1 Tax=Ramlibacter albus TaxID=2079448 RepID=A0A923S568_9BURK|nr:Tim44-like domain-containing protein [Ramlibacter albus]MBC5768201.1 Tim44 domain-containing protein [Ramlibacter albus]
MRRTLALLAVVFAVGATGAFDAQAKRLGGGKSSGMQRQSVNNTAPAAPAGTPATPSQAAAPSAATAAAAAPAAATAAKRSWMGPIAGIAAGLGIAALASHFGFGEALANMLTIALVVMAVLFVVGFILRKRAQQRGEGLQPAYAGQAPARTPFEALQGNNTMPRTGSLIGSQVQGSIPAGFDTAAFERNAKNQFMALQAANDAGDIDQLRTFLTPDMLSAAQDELRERNGQPQATEVFGLEARVLEVVTEAHQHIASVRFTGSLRQQPGVEPEPLDEVWHLVKPVAGTQGWLVAGIQQA